MGRKLHNVHYRPCSSLELQAHPRSFHGSILYCHKGVGVLLALAQEARYGHIEEFKNAQTQR